MDTKKIMKAMWFTPMKKTKRGHIWAPPMLIEGEPGMAKSSIIEQLAAECNMHCETILGSIRAPEDFSGLPFPVEGFVENLPMGWAKRCTEAKHSVMFFDEQNTATERTLHAMLRVVLDRVVGDFPLPGSVRVMGAQNSTADAHGVDLTAPMGNRWLHWKGWGNQIGVLDWTDYILGQGLEDEIDGGDFDPAKEEARVLKAFPTPFAKSKGLITGFLKAKEDLLYKKPSADDPEQSKAWPSLRTWEMAIRVLAGAEVHGLSASEGEFLLAGCVGESPAAEFVTYLQHADLPDPEDVLDGKVKWKADNRLDRTLAVFNSCAALVVPSDAPKREDRAAALWELVAEVADDKVDVAVSAVRSLVRARLSSMKAAKPAMVKLGPIFAEAGLMPS